MYVSPFCPTPAFDSIGRLISTTTFSAIPLAYWMSLAFTEQNNNIQGKMADDSIPDITRFQMYLFGEHVCTAKFNFSELLVITDVSLSLCS